MSKHRPKILAISSGGGHWVQLLRLRPAFEGGDVLFATTRPGYESDLDQGERFTVIPDATRWSKIGLVKSALSILLLLLRERPDVVITTGAAPGYFAIRMARIIGSKTVWVDSVANVEELSMS
ncbi:MAG: oligosaccharide biosynthesis protein Alg14, partial [Verrucomicrobiota bacterium]